MSAESQDQCVLLDSFGRWVQAACGLAAFSVLLIKRYWEKPRRPLKIWALDASKQCFAMLCAHFIGMLTAEIVSGSVDAGSACSWYFLAFTIDVTLGVIISLVIFKASLIGAKRYNWRSLYASGDYGHKVSSKGQLTIQPRYSIWLIQTLHFALVCVAPARFICMAFTYANRSWLADTAGAISSLFVGHPKAQLLTVMLAGPLVMNAAQFLLQDAVLKLSSSGGGKKFVETSRAIFVMLGLLQKTRARAASISNPQAANVKAHEVLNFHYSDEVDEEAGLINRTRYDQNLDSGSTSQCHSEFKSLGQTYQLEEDLMLEPVVHDVHAPIFPDQGRA